MNPGKTPGKTPSKTPKDEFAQYLLGRVGMAGGPTNPATYKDMSVLLQL
jgi:hypothetical protein